MSPNIVYVGGVMGLHYVLVVSDSILRLQIEYNMTYTTHSALPPPMDTNVVKVSTLAQFEDTTIYACGQRHAYIKASNFKFSNISFGDKVPIIYLLSHGMDYFMAYRVNDLTSEIDSDFMSACKPVADHALGNRPGIVIVEGHLNGSINNLYALDAYAHEDEIPAYVEHAKNVGFSVSRVHTVTTKKTIDEVLYDLECDGKYERGYGLFLSTVDPSGYC